MIKVVLTLDQYDRSHYDVSVFDSGDDQSLIAEYRVANTESKYAIIKRVEAIANLVAIEQATIHHLDNVSITYEIR